MFSEPIGLEMVASALKSEHETELLDLMSAPEAELEQRIATFRPQAVGLTSLCVDVPAVHKLAARIKALSPNVLTVVGGTQAFLNPEAFFTPEIDYVVQVSTKEGLQQLFAELEETMASSENSSENPSENPSEPPKMDQKAHKTRIWSGMQLLNPSLSAVVGTTLGTETGIQPQSIPPSDAQSNPELKLLPKINEYWLPDREITSAWRGTYAYFGFRPCAIMQTAQGCSSHCEFCLRWRMEGPCETYFPMDFVMADLKSIPEPSVMIFDNDFLHSGDRLSAFCDRLEQEGITKNFICYASVHSILKFPDQIRRFRDLGLKAVLVGYESARSEDLEAYKKPSGVEDGLKAAKWLKEAGIDVWASFILHPDWDHSDFKALRRHIKTLSPEIATFSPLTPFPGLPLYKRYEDRLLFKKEDYTAWSFGQVIIRPNKMTLRTYYIEVLKTILYLNFVSNHLSYIIRKFGPLTLVRMTRGAVKVFFRDVDLMRRA
jgi:radical SAM superfamily enzyme YgiQ (UPF0313 family)